MKIALCTCFLLLWANIVMSGTIKGKVQDNKGLTLPYATIYVEGTTTGTNANNDGLYELTLSPGKYQLICQYIGYKQVKYDFEVTDASVTTHDFVLQPQGLEMKEVVIHANAEDPAYGIIRDAIKQRGRHLSQAQSFQSAIYLKGNIRLRKIPESIRKRLKVGVNGGKTDTSGILYLVEEEADYYRSGKKEKTIIRSVRQSGNPNGLGMSSFPSVISFYENNVKISTDDSRGFISPISDHALNYYRYHFEGQFTEGDHTIYKIEVTPKRPYEPCFQGTVFIVDKEFAMHSIHLEVNKGSGLEDFDTLRLDQIYIPTAENNWVIKSQVIYYAVSFIGVDATAGFITVYNRQKNNANLPDSLFEDKVTSVYDKDATKKDSTYWTAQRPIPLISDEKKDFVVKDSTYKVLNDPIRLDSLRKKQNKLKISKLALGGYQYKSSKDVNYIFTNSLLVGLTEDNTVNFNNVEGLNVAPRVHFKHLIDTGYGIYGTLAARYGFANTHFNGIGKVLLLNTDPKWRGRNQLFGIEGGKYVFQFNPENPVLPWFESFSTLLYRQNDLRLYEKWVGAAYAGRNYGNGLSWFVKTSYENRIPLSNTTNYSIAGNSREILQSNAPGAMIHAATQWVQHDAFLIHAEMSYQPGITYTQFPDFKRSNGSNWPVATLIYNKGLPDVFNSKVNYDNYRVKLGNESINLKLFGELGYSIAVGGFINKAYVAPPDLMHLYGDRGFGYAAPYLESFQFAQYYTFSNSASFYQEAHLEYHMNGLLSNKIPGLKQLHWYIVTGGNMFYVTDALYYTEAFIGLENVAIN